MSAVKSSYNKWTTPMVLTKGRSVTDPQPPEQRKPALHAGWLLRKEEIRKRLSLDEQKLLAAHSNRVHLKKGELLWFEENDEPMVYVLDEGLAGLCKMDNEGHKFYIELLAPGDVFGQLVPHHIDVPVEDYLEVIRDARMIIINANVFHEIVMQHPDFLTRLIELMSQHYHLLQKRFTNVLSKDVEARTAEFLLDFCQKLGMPCAYALEHVRDIQLTHQEIADMICATRPVVSAVLSEFAKAGYIRKHDNVLCLADRDGLQQVSLS